MGRFYASNFTGAARVDFSCRPIGDYGCRRDVFDALRYAAWAQRASAVVQPVCVTPRDVGGYRLVEAGVFDDACRVPCGLRGGNSDRDECVPCSKSCDSCWCVHCATGSGQSRTRKQKRSGPRQPPQRYETTSAT